MEIRVPYGRTFLTAVIPEHIRVDIIEAVETPPAANPNELVRSALNNLIGEVKWSDFVGSQTVAIAVNDKTRPVPHDLLLPPLMDRLSALGIPDSAITFYIAVGTHPVITNDDFPSILPAEIIRRYKIVSHDSENEEMMVFLGQTSRETPIWSNKNYVSSDLKIVVGNIEPHQFAGFSGGVKTAAIGLSALQTINHNHTLLTHPEAKLGTYMKNPVRQDIEEIGQKINVHLAINAVLNQQKQIFQVLAGDPRIVVRTGLETSRSACQVAVSQKYGLIITSPGGYPKDINLYQSQKALAHASLITRAGGTVILVAACTEGTGSNHYEDWMQDKHSHAQVLQQFSAEGFRIGPHKAFQIARDASRVKMMFCSEMNEKLSHKLLLNPVSELQTAIDLAIAAMKPGELVGVMPHASSTIPFLME